MWADGRSNVVARFDGSADRPTILLDAHQDTVPVEGMVIEPFDPVVRDGRIYGRGACDVKGGMVAMLGAVERMVREKPAESSDRDYGLYLRRRIWAAGRQARNEAHCRGKLKLFAFGKKHPMLRSLPSRLNWM